MRNGLIIYLLNFLDLQCGGLKDRRRGRHRASVAPTGGSSKSITRRRRTPSTAATETWPNVSTRRSATSSPKRTNNSKSKPKPEPSLPVGTSGRPTMRGWPPTWADRRLWGQRTASMTNGTTSTTTWHLHSHRKNKNKNKRGRKSWKRKWMPHRRRCRRRRAGRTSSATWTKRSSTSATSSTTVRDNIPNWNSLNAVLRHSTNSTRLISST